MVVDRGDRPRPVHPEAAVERLVQSLSAADRQPSVWSTGARHQSGAQAPASAARTWRSRRAICDELEQAFTETEGAEVPADTGCPPRTAARRDRRLPVALRAARRSRTVPSEDIGGPRIPS